ncbi:lipocalin family protein [uncultured Alistipes sp.]|uniref:lipocalin family protein n=1 Tax=uncultured Alistipes sp. TaxID=538949 RepID=UPI00261CF2AB|nr:lipocalin family protein [uncultured Alistipes sp.]
MKPKSICKGICGLFASLAFVACNEADIEGAWIEPIPGMENTMQGIDLKKGGEASSINMATLQYETWTKDGDLLILSGRSIGNGTTIPFTDTLVIEKLTDDELSLKRGELVIRYKKQE